MEFSISILQNKYCISSRVAVPAISLPIIDQGLIFAGSIHQSTRYWADEYSAMTNNHRPRLLFGTIFLAIMVLILLLRNWLERQAIDYRVMLSGNAILFFATLLSFYLFKRSYQKTNAQYILRMVYGGIFSKLAICVLSAFTYILIARSGVDKIALFTCFGFYFIYTFTEVKLLIQLSKEQKNA